MFFAVVNVGTRDGAAISAIHPAMQLPIVMHLPPKAGRYAAYENNAQDPDGSAAPLMSENVGATGSLKAARHGIETAEFFARVLEEHNEDKEIHELLLQQQKDGIHGKVHFLSVPQRHLLLLQRRKNEASLEQRLLQWANTLTNRCVFLHRVNVTAVLFS